MFSVGDPGASVGVAVDADEGAVAVHPAGDELALVGGAGGPREAALAARFALLPFSLVHAPVRPEVLAGAVRRVPGEASAVDVAVREGLLHRAGGHAPRPRRTAARRRREEEFDNVVFVGGVVVVVVL